MIFLVICIISFDVGNCIILCSAGFTQTTVILLEVQAYRCSIRIVYVLQPDYIVSTVITITIERSRKRVKIYIFFLTAILCGFPTFINYKSQVLDFVLLVKVRIIGFNGVAIYSKNILHVIEPFIRCFPGIILFVSHGYIGICDFISYSIDNSKVCIAGIFNGDLISKRILHAFHHAIAIKIDRSSIQILHTILSATGLFDNHILKWIAFQIGCCFSFEIDFISRTIGKN